MARSTSVILGFFTKTFPIWISEFRARSAKAQELQCGRPNKQKKKMTGGNREDIGRNKGQSQSGLASLSGLISILSLNFMQLDSNPDFYILKKLS